MKVALIQFGAGANKARNIEKAAALVKRAIEAKASFVLLPEVFSYRGIIESKGWLQQVAEDIPGESLKPLMILAKKNKVFILAGSIFEKIKGSRKVYNTSVLINDRGNIQAVYRKKHLFNASLGKNRIQESKNFLQGTREVLTKVKDFQVGMSICYDLRFPDLYQVYGEMKADVLVVPSAFTKKTGEAHWEVLLRARAIENRCYVLAPNQIGKDARAIASYGNSMVVDPWGRILARASNNKEEIVYAEVDKKILGETRAILPMAKR